MALKHKVRIAIGLHEYKHINEVVDILGQMHDIEIVADSEEAYHTIHAFKPDIAVLDYALSKIHPIELYEGIALAHANVHFVICVTEENYRIAQRVWKRRASDFIFKPFHPAQFVNDINKIVRNVFNFKEIEELNERIKLLEKELKNLRIHL